MATTKPIDIDRVARRALKAVAKTPDLFKDGFPFDPGWVNIVVEQIAPRTVSDGGIEVVEDSVTAEAIQCTVARVLKAGPAAMEGKTASGIELKNFHKDIQTVEQLIGKFVIFQLHCGQELTLRKTGQKIRVLKVTDLLGVTADPQAWKFYI
jgi:hypothetical protein